MQRRPLLVDVDTGIDDSLALLYACASPEAEMVAATCVAGNTDARQAGLNTRAVLELAGRGDVEVALGRPVPLSRPLITTPETHGPLGIGWAELPEPARDVSERHAADLVRDEIRRRPGELTLVTLGPLTNIALAFHADPELARLVGRLVIMGGSYRSPGNTSPTTEWNVSCDPEAAQIVFAAFTPAVVDARLAAGLDPRPIALGLDVTERARILPAHLERLAAAAGSADGSSPVVRFVGDALRFYMEFHEKHDGFCGAFIHDPLALAAALDPSLVETRPLRVDVELAGTLTTGETVADWRGARGLPPNVDVAVATDAEAFLERFIERVGRLARERASA